MSAYGIWHRCVVKKNVGGVVVVEEVVVAAGTVAVAVA